MTQGEERLFELSFYPKPRWTEASGKPSGLLVALPVGRTWSLWDREDCLLDAQGQCQRELINVSAKRGKTFNLLPLVFVPMYLDMMRFGLISMEGMFI